MCVSKSLSTGNLLSHHCAERLQENAHTKWFSTLSVVSKLGGDCHTTGRLENAKKGSLRRVRPEKPTHLAASRKRELDWVTLSTCASRNVSSVFSSSRGD